MSPGGLKRLDRFLGSCAPGLVHALRPLLSLPFLPQRPGKPNPKPLLVRPGGLGDLVCLHMAMEAAGLDIRQYRFLLERRSEPWAVLHGLDYLSYDGSEVKALLQERCASADVVCTEQRFGLALAFAEACRAPNGRLIAFETCRGVRWAGAERVAYHPKKSHEVEAFFDLLQHAFPDQVDPAASALAERTRWAWSDGSLVACLSGGGQPSREFSPDRWVEFLDAWAGQRLVILTSAPGDRETAEAIVRRRVSPTKLCPGGFAEAVMAIEKSEAVLTVDGGMTHVASYYGVPGTVIFTSGQVEKWRPLAQGGRVVAVDGLPCRPCTLFGQVPPCPHGFRCKDIPLRQLTQSCRVGD